MEFICSLGSAVCQMVNRYVLNRECLPAVGYGKLRQRKCRIRGQGSTDRVSWQFGRQSDRQFQVTSRGRASATLELLRRHFRVTTQARLERRPG